MMARGKWWFHAFMIESEEKHKKPGSGFELLRLIQFPAMITIPPRRSQQVLFLLVERINIYYDCFVHPISHEGVVPTSYFKMFRKHMLKPSSNEKKITCQEQSHSTKRHLTKDIKKFVLFVCERELYEVLFRTKNLFNFCFGYQIIFWINIK